MDSDATRESIGGVAAATRVVFRRMAKASAARLVLNHSSHIPGLLPALKHLCNLLPHGRVTPGVISRCRPAHERGFRLSLSHATPIQGNFKLIARRGSTVQEVFVISHGVSREALAAAASESAESTSGSKG